jgi:universal stress protein A
MHSPSRILVPVDFSDPSLAALKYAALLGAQLGASLDLFHVWRPPEDVQSRTEILAEFARSEAGHKMMEWLAPFELSTSVEARGRVTTGRQGHVSDAILEEAEAGEYDLVVMGTHMRQGFWNLLKGGVTAEIVRRSSCPVLTVRAEDDLPVQGISCQEWTDEGEPGRAVSARAS